MCSLKCKAEPTALTPAKALKASTTLRMRTPADDAAWLARYRAAMERLKSTGSFVQASESIGEAVGAKEAARRPKLVEAALGASRHGQSGGDGRRSMLRQGCWPAGGTPTPRVNSGYDRSHSR
jgi:hypothetical protein